jgi:hypothetical protein
MASKLEERVAGNGDRIERLEGLLVSALGLRLSDFDPDGARLAEQAAPVVEEPVPVVEPLTLERRVALLEQIAAASLGVSLELIAAEDD